MTKPLRFSLRLNNDLPLVAYRELARKAEAAGFQQFWVSNDLFLKSAPVILAAVAMETERIEIGTCILNPYTIDPSEIAMIAATMDELSGNRFNLGLAAGAADFMGWVGIEHRYPLTAVRESVQAIRAALRGEPASSKGKVVRWSPEAYLRFDAPRVTPIYLGALSPKMLELAGELGDGVLPLLFPPEHYHQVKPLVDRGTPRREASLPEVDLAACIWISLDADGDKARRALAEKIAYYGQALSPLILERLSLRREDFAPIRQAMVVERDWDKACALVDDRMLAIGVTGEPHHLIERLEPLVAAGVRHLSFGPPLGPDPLAAVELLGREVLPYFRS